MGKRSRKEYTVIDRINASKIKNQCYAITNRAIKNSLLLEKKICDRCGEHTKLNKHHIDYTQPLLIDWLCDGCHFFEHTTNREYYENHSKELSKLKPS